MRIGLWTWPSFVILDAYMCFVAYPGAPFGLFVAYRLGLEVVFALVYRASRRDSVDSRVLFQWHSLTFIAAAALIAFMAIHLGGIRSSYMHGISVVALVWAVLMPIHWRRALPTFLGIGLAFPVVIAATAILSPAARAAWLTRDALVVFAANYVFVVASSILGVILCHVVWTARQEIESLGSYRLEELLGRGGMGEVWRAKHRLLARRAAIKLVRPEALGGERGNRDAVLTRFEREAQTTASLSSPHTIDLYDFGVSEGGRFYYVMELLDGYDAAELVQRFGPMPAERVVYLLQQVCESLGEAHAAGLIHRDIKPSNIYICRYGRAFDFVKVLDFGLVKHRNPHVTQLTADQTLSGTPAFMAPEQILGTGALDARSDIYAVGCVAYWLLTGSEVFQAETSLQVMLAHAYKPPVPPSERGDHPIPEALEAAVMACLAKDPDARPGSADDLSSILSRVDSGEDWTQEKARLWWRHHALVDERNQFSG